MDLNFRDGWIAEFVSRRGGASNGFMQEWIRFSWLFLCSVDKRFWKILLDESVI